VIGFALEAEARHRHKPVARIKSRTKATEAAPNKSRSVNIDDAARNGAVTIREALSL
jgi:hypothetical protein